MHLHIFSLFFLCIPTLTQYFNPKRKVESGSPQRMSSLWIPLSLGWTMGPSTAFPIVETGTQTQPAQAMDDDKGLMSDETGSLLTVFVLLVYASCRIFFAFWFACLLVPSFVFFLFLFSNLGFGGFFLSILAFAGFLCWQVRVCL
ncbi:hypothetical protein BDV30DRAFT_168528 [Aspergillus minisclerotigenes]|uniref:Uncharacterized protein n=1 Tax=Aspergillus minisclerotigenes TaxID=656917 RepID=A0A5N6JG42_9EURO|nr:hypothetical protein BDV30DRAFT_168528 [Aspergillus minisclerotigenes]